MKTIRNKMDSKIYSKIICSNIPTSNEKLNFIELDINENIWFGFGNEFGEIKWYKDEIK